jgi:hypothetical protein
LAGRDRGIVALVATAEVVASLLMIPLVRPELVGLIPSFALECVVDRLSAQLRVIMSTLAESALARLHALLRMAPAVTTG